MLGIACNHPVRSWGKAEGVCGSAEAIAGDLPATAWKRLSAGEGTKGARLHEWGYVELADLDPTMFAEATPAGTEGARDPGAASLWTRGLLIRRFLADGKMAFFSTWCLDGTPIDRLVHVQGHRWA